MVQPLSLVSALPIAVRTAELFAKSYESCQNRKLRLLEVEANLEIEKATIAQRSETMQIACDIHNTDAAIRSIAVQALSSCASKLIDAGQYDHARDVCDKVSLLAEPGKVPAIAPFFD